MFDEMVMEQLGQFKDKVPFSIENDIIEDSIDGENVEDTLLDDTIPTADQENLVEWAKKVRYLIDLSYFRPKNYLLSGGFLVKISLLLIF